MTTDIDRCPTDNSRRGVATVELAICLPVIMLVVFGAIEACSMIYMQQTVQTVAYETARFAVTPRSTSAAALSRGQQVLSDRGIQGAAIRLNPSDLTTADRGTNVVVNVSVPFGQNRVMRRYFFGDRQLEANVTMLRE